MRSLVIYVVFSVFFVGFLSPANATEQCQKEITPAGNCQIHCTSQDGQGAVFCYGSSDLCDLEEASGKCFQQKSSEENCWQFSYVSCNATTCSIERLNFPKGC